MKGLTKLTDIWLDHNSLVVNNISGNVFKNVKAIQNLRLDANSYTNVTKIYGAIVENLPELYRLEFDVVTDYEFEIEFTYLKNLSKLIIHTKSYDGFYFRKSAFKHLPLTQIKFLEIDRIKKLTTIPSVI